MTIAEIPTSAVLLGRLRDGTDADARIQLVQRYRQPMIDFAYARKYHTIDIEAAVQETLRIVIEQVARGRYDVSRGRFRSWMLGILLHRLNNAVRSESCRRRREQAFEEMRVPGADMMSDEALWRRVCLRRALERLLTDETIAARSRAVFHAYVLRGEPAASVAEAYGLTPNAVHQIKARLFARLRGIMRTLR